MSDYAVGVITLGILTAFWLAGAIAAWAEGMLTVGQMHAQGVKKGMPYLHHHGMWNDLVVIHPLLAWFTGMYWKEWADETWFLPVILVSFPVSFLANHHWVQDHNIIQAHARIAGDKFHSTGEMSFVGWIHVPHMAVVTTMIAMVLGSIVMGEVTLNLAIATLGFLIGHALIGGHPFLRLSNPPWNPWPLSQAEDLQSIAYCSLMMISVAVLILWIYQ